VTPQEDGDGGDVQPDRRGAIADAGIALVARDGIRALTHRAIDRELGLPAGSTSYYLRTRRSLIEALVHRLVERTVQEVDGPGPTTVDEAAELLGAMTAHLITERAVDNRARFALAVELAGDPDLHAFVTSRSPIRAALRQQAEALLTAIGVPDAARRAPDLIALADGLVHDRLVGSRSDVKERPAELRAALTAVFADYLHGATLDATAPGK
jgi:DNA-binding transcriptional regulator YbjK